MGAYNTDNMYIKTNNTKENYFLAKPLANLLMAYLIFFTGETVNI